jgi:WD40 repeat protein
MFEPFTRSDDSVAIRESLAALARVSFLRVDFEQAELWLNELARLKDINLQYAPDRIRWVKNLRTVLRQQEDYFGEYPYYVSWLNRFGLRGLEVRLSHSSGDLESRGATQLRGIKSVIGTEHWNSVVFSVIGSGSGNEGESAALQRATNVANWMTKNLGLQQSQLQIRSTVAPVASAKNDAGVPEEVSRTVQIHIGGDLRSPSLAVPASLPPNLGNVSGAGRLAVLDGEVWDLQRRARLFRLADNDGGVDGSPAFSPNGQWIASRFLSTDGDFLIITDTGTGVPIRIFAAPSSYIGCVQWSPDGSRIALGRYKGLEPAGFTVINANSGRSIGGAYTNNTPTENIVWMDGGKMLAVQTWASYRVPVYSTTTWETIRELTDVRWAHSIGATVDGGTLLIGDDKTVLHVYDVVNDFRHTSVKTDLKIKGQIAIHPREPFALCNNYTRIQWRVADFDKLTVSKMHGYNGTRKTDSTTVKARWVLNGSKLLIENAEFGYTLADSQLKSYNSFETSGSKLLGSAAFSDLALLVTVDEEGVHVWDIVTGKRMHFWEEEDCKYLGSLPGRKSFLAVVENKAEKESVVYRYDLRDFRRSPVCELGNFEIHKHCIRGSKAVFAGTVFAREGEHSPIPTGSLKVVSLDDRAVTSESEVKMMATELREGELGRTRFSVLAVNESATQAILRTEWEDGHSGWGMTKERQLRFFNLLTGKQTDAESFTTAPSAAFFETDDRYRVSMSEGQSDAIYRMVDHQYLETSSQDSRRRIQANGYDEKLKDAFADRNLSVKVRATNEIDFFRRDTNDLVLTILVRKDGKWLAVSPTGEFSASLDGDQGVFWRVGSELLPLDSLRDQFERPDLVASQLSRIASVEEAPRASLIDTSLFTLPYESRLVSKADAKTTANSYELILEVDSKFEDTPDPEIEFLHNGRVIQQDRGKLKLIRSTIAKTTTIKRSFILQDGLNLIEARLVYKRARVLPVTARIVKEASNALTGRINIALAPRLYFFGVGVSRYELQEQNLDYAHADAIALEKSFKAQEGVLYSKVKSKVLTDDRARARDIQFEMLDFLEQASSQDVVVIFLAGHGVKDSRENLYFIPHDGVLDRPRTGMDMEFFSKALIQRPENQKALFLIDICHAGATSRKFSPRGNVVSEEVVKQLTEGTGTIVLASSTGAQSSFEDESFGGGHGAFTFAILEGISGKANLDQDDSAISVNELTTFVCRRVPEITDKNQHPTTPNAHNVRDFPLVAK